MSVAAAALAPVVTGGGCVMLPQPPRHPVVVFAAERSFGGGEHAELPCRGGRRLPLGNSSQAIPA